MSPFNKILLFVAILLIICIAVVAYALFMQSDNSSNGSDTLQTENNLSEDQGTKNAEREAFSAFVSASDLWQEGKTIEAIRAFKAILTNPRYSVADRVRADSVTRIVTVYTSNPTQENFNEIFLGSPQLFKELLADEEALPSQIEVSLLNMFRYSSEIMPTAEAEIKIANTLFNHNREFYLRMFNECKEQKDASFEGCRPNFDAMTEEELQLYKAIQDQFEERMIRVDLDMQNLKNVGKIRALAYVSAFKVRVLHKSMYFGFVSPGIVQTALEESIAYAERAGNEDEILSARIESAVFHVLLWPDPTPEQATIINDLIAPLIEDDGELAHLQDLYLGRLTVPYQELNNPNGVHTANYEMALRGPLAIAMASPAWKDFLVQKGGFDFSGLAITTIMNGGSSNGN